MTSGRRPALLAGILRSLRPIADEIVVAAEVAAAESVAGAVGEVADLVLSFPPAPPADRPIPWLFGACSGAWILNVDDDEVPSPRLLAAVPAIVERDDITHAWIARRWLHPSTETYLAQPPWSTEFQLRLVLSDARFLQFSDVFHRPVVCHGPSLFLDAPLWHLDTALNPAASRVRKAEAYERERPGMRLGSLAHNSGVYVPELTPEPVLADVPDEDRTAIEAALHTRLAPTGAGRASRRSASRDDIDRLWPGPPYDDSLYRGHLTVLAAPATLTANVQETIDVRVTNGSDRVWGWGKDARPAIRLGYRWSRAGVAVEDTLRLRTPLPADLPPGQTQVVPVHVVAPPDQGAHVLEIDLLHERERWFDCGVSFPVDVERQERVAVVSRPEELPDLAASLKLAPSVEVVAVLRDRADREQYGDYETVEGVRPHLLRATESRGRWRTLWFLLARTAAVARAARRDSREERSLDSILRPVSATDRLVIGGPNWAPEAAQGREWWALTATALAWRLRHRPVVLGEGAYPQGSRLRDRALRWSLRRLSRPS